MFEYDIRNPLVHVPLSLTDTCQLFLSITERGQKDHNEYETEVQGYRQEGPIVADFTYSIW